MISLPALTNIINMFELSYGLLAAKGEERQYLKVFSREQLPDIEAAYIQQAESLLNDSNLFDLLNWKMISYLLECFDPDYIKTYLSNALLNSDNIVKYLRGSLSKWTGGRTEYELHNDYQKYLSDEGISKAIDEQKNSGKLFLQSKQVQNACAAYILSTSGKANDDGHVELADIDELLNSWKENCPAPMQDGKTV